MKKLAAHRISLLSLLSLFALYVTVSAGLAIDHAVLGEGDVSDEVISILSLFLLLAFLILEIVNTARSFKGGSEFLIRLCYEENGEKNAVFFGLSILLDAIGAFCFVWGILLLSGVNVFLFRSIPWDGGNLILSFGALLLVDFTMSLLFFSCGEFDPNHPKNRQKKKNGSKN